MKDCSGKTATIFLILFSVLLLSLTAITLFLFQKEREMRKTTELKLEVIQQDAQQLKQELDLAIKDKALLEQSKKEIEQKINGLLDEIDLEKGISEGLKQERLSLSKQLNDLADQKKRVEQERAVLTDKIQSLEDQLAEEKMLREDVEREVEKYKEQELSNAHISLDKIVVTPPINGFSEDALQGKILRINPENNFIIVDLGKTDLLEPDMILEIYRRKEFFGHAQVVSVQKSMSVADLVPPLSADQLSLSDQVLLKK
jgi:hypothetical protein